jgi:hypothetical protein
MRDAASFWLSWATRLIAATGLSFETFIDHLRNPTALVVFGGLAGLPDVLGYRAQLKGEVEREEQHNRESRR